MASLRTRNPLACSAAPVARRNAAADPTAHLEGVTLAGSFHASDPRAALRAIKCTIGAAGRYSPRHCDCIVAAPKRNKGHLPSCNQREALRKSKEDATCLRACLVVVPADSSWEDLQDGDAQRVGFTMSRGTARSVERFLEKLAKADPVPKLPDGARAEHFRSAGRHDVVVYAPVFAEDHEGNPSAVAVGIKYGATKYSATVLESGRRVPLARKEKRKLLTQAILRFRKMPVVLREPQRSSDGAVVVRRQARWEAVLLALSARERHRLQNAVARHHGQRRAPPQARVVPTAKGKRADEDVAVRKVLRSAFWNKGVETPKLWKANPTPKPKPKVGAGPGSGWEPLWPSTE